MNKAILNISELIHQDLLTKEGSNAKDELIFYGMLKTQCSSKVFEQFRNNFF